MQTCKHAYTLPQATAGKEYGSRAGKKGRGEKKGGRMNFLGLVVLCNVTVYIPVKNRSCSGAQAGGIVIFEL